MVLPKESGNACAGDLYYLLLSGRENCEGSLSRLCSRNNNHCHPVLKSYPVIIGGPQNHLFLDNFYPILLCQIQNPQGMSTIPWFQRLRFYMLEMGEKRREIRRRNQ